MPHPLGTILQTTLLMWETGWILFQLHETPMVESTIPPLHPIYQPQEMVFNQVRLTFTGGLQTSQRTFQIPPLLNSAT